MRILLLEIATRLILTWFVLYWLGCLCHDDIFYSIDLVVQETLESRLALRHLALAKCGGSLES